MQRIHDKNIEVLAPAGNMEAFYGAINNGAQAVYLGGKNFNARQNSDNFSDQQLLEIIDYAHVKNANVYVTVNILIKNKELDEAINFIRFLYHAGVDGVIIQDLGLLFLINQEFPALQVNISTQMSIYDIYGVKFFEKFNVGKCIVARELSLAQIGEICRQTKLDIEVFVHGALCTGYSGQCYFSSFLGGRSGNRGQCAQPCRLNYSIIDKQKNVVGQFNQFPLFSLKDHRAGNLILDLANLGVKSFKIEGRMKGAEYAAIVVEYYNRILNGEDQSKSEKLLEKVFNRGFTDAYLRATPSLEMFAKLSSGLKNEDLKPGMSDLFKFNSKSRRIGIDLKASFLIDKCLTMSVSDGINKIEVAEEFMVQASRSKPTTEENIVQQINKVGSTVFEINDLKIIKDADVFIPKSKINDLRRKALDQLYQLRSQKYERASLAPIEIDWQAIKQPQKELGISLKVTDLDKIDFKLFSKIKRIYLELDQIIENRVKIQQIIDQCDLYLYVPNIVSDDYYQKFEAQAELVQDICQGVCINNIGSLYFFQNYPALKIHCGANFNILNNFSVKLLAENNISGFTASIEANIKDIKIMAQSALTSEIVAFEHLKLLSMKNCPLAFIKKCKNHKNCKNCNIYDNYEIEDRKNTKLLIERQDSLTNMYNSVPLSLIGKISEVKAANLELVFINDKFVNNINSIIDTIDAEIHNSKVSMQKNKIKNFTRGHYFKQVL